MTELTSNAKRLSVKAYQLADFIENMINLLEDPSLRKAKKTVVLFKKLVYEF